MFTFFGLFADPVSGLAEQVARAWPSLNVIRIERPISAVAARFDTGSYDREIEERPGPVIQAVERLSRNFPGARLLLLRTECWGGICENRGEIIQDGHTVLEADGDGALRRLVKHWGVDLGPKEIFEPLRRDFPWEQQK